MPPNADPFERTYGVVEVMKPCKRCGREIAWRRQNARYCSVACRVAAQVKRRRERNRDRFYRPDGKWHKVCRQCGEAFESIRGDAKFCSPKCRQRSHRSQAAASIQPSPQVQQQQPVSPPQRRQPVSALQRKQPASPPAELAAGRGDAPDYEVPTFGEGP
jgi:hypothetical protein